MAFTEITNLGQASDMALRMVHEDDSANLGAQDVKFFLNESERILLGQQYYPFLDITKVFVQSKDTRLDEDVAITDVEFDVVDSSELFTSGTVLIDGSFISYTGNDNVKTLSGVTGLSIPLKEGAQVQQIYHLANDLNISQFDKPIFLSVDGRELPYYDSRDGFRNDGYTIYFGYLIIPYSTSQPTINFRYKAAVGSMTDDTDTFTTPQKYIGAHIQYAVYQSKIIIGDPTVNENKAEYMRLKNIFVSDYGNQTEKKNKFLHSPYIS